MDRTENKSGKLKYYTDLNVRTGPNATTLRFFLSDLGEHKVILGYPWFMAMQPRIDWKRGWIDHSQLPIVIRAPNTQKAVTPRDCSRMIHFFLSPLSSYLYYTFYLAPLVSIYFWSFLRHSASFSNIPDSLLGNPDTWLCSLIHFDF